MKLKKVGVLNEKNDSVFFCWIVLAGCTAVTVRPVSRSLELKSVCIRENHRVQVTDFLNVLRDGFDRHGIATYVYSGNIPVDCKYILTYTALRSWDISPYLSHAEIRIEKDGRQVAYAEYHLRRKGGLSLAKWRGTRSKMNSVIDELLKAY